MLTLLLLLHGCAGGPPAPPPPAATATTTTLDQGVVRLAGGSRDAFSGRIQAPGQALLRIRTDGRGSAVSSEEVARRFLQGVARDSGLVPPGSEWTLRFVHSTRGRTRLHFRQGIDGYSVEASDVVIEVRDGEVSVAATHILPGPVLLPNPAVSRSGAIRVASRVGRPGRPVASGARLVVVATELTKDEPVTPPRLAWRVPLAVPGGEPPHAFAYVDAVTGGGVVRVEPRLGVLDLVVRDAADDPSYNSQACGNVTAYTQWFDESGLTQACASGAVGCPPSEVATVDGYLLETLRFFRRRGYDPTERVLAVARVPSNASSAAGVLPDGQYRCQRIEIATGWVARDIVAHETSHLVVDRLTGLRAATAGPGRALHEALADIFADVLDGDWVVMDRVDGSVNLFGYVRNNADPSRTFPTPYPSRWGGVYSRDPYADAAPFVLAAVRIADGWWDGVARTGLGREETGRLFFDAVTLLSETDGLEEMRDAVVTQVLEDIVDHQVDTSAACTVIDAFASTGFGETCLQSHRDRDDDGDLVPDSADNCPGFPNGFQSDADADGVGDACETDYDGDGLCDRGGGAGCEAGGCEGTDNCVLAANPGQEDADGDHVGDACDDDDRDGLPTANDNCPAAPNRDQHDIDRDGLGDTCDPDRDGDSVCEMASCTDANCKAGCDDNCPDAPNRDQADGDDDGFGDACDLCPGTASADNRDIDGDTQGDACDDDDDDDGLADRQDHCPGDYDPYDLHVGRYYLACSDIREALADSILIEGVLPTEEAPLDIPVVPCWADGCPDHLPGAVRTTISFALRGADAAGVDLTLDDGTRLASEDGEQGVLAVVYPPDTSLRWAKGGLARRATLTVRHVGAWASGAPLAIELRSVPTSSE